MTVRGDAWEGEAALWQQRENRRGRAGEAAAALLAGDEAPARRLLRSAGWYVADDPSLCGALLRHLLATLPEPHAVALSACLSPPEALPVVRATTPFVLRQTLHEIAPPYPAPSPPARLAWALESLAFLGEEVERYDRRAWLGRDYPPRPTDAEVARLWRAWEAGKAWSIRAKWERLFLQDGGNAFLAALERGDSPGLRSDFVEAFFLVCLDAAPGEPPGWRKIQARVLETAPAGPFPALVAAIPDGLWPAVGEAMVRQGTRALSARLAFPEVSDVQVRARRAAEACRADGTCLERLLDFHVAIRLIEKWQTPRHLDPQASWQVLTQNRGRARSRLRAVIAGLPSPPDLAAAGIGEAGLTERTRYAIRRFCRDWAREQISRGFPMGHARAVDPPCVLAPPPESACPDRRAILRCWVLLVVLRGQVARLRRWVESRDGGGDTAFYRLLSEQLPPALRGPPRPGDRSGLGYLRAELSLALPAVEAELRPTLTKVAALRGPGLTERFRRCLAPEWHPAVPLPGGRIGGYIANADEWLRGGHHEVR